MSLIQTALLGSIIGLPFGYILQRTKLCFNSAYREAILNKNLVLVRMIITAVLVQLVGLAILIQFQVGGISTNIVPFYWLAVIIGGFIFGISMVYAEGCSSTIWYRLGNGNLGALVTLVGFGISEWALRFGPFRGFLSAIQSYEITLQGGKLATLPNTLGLNPWLVVIPLSRSQYGGCGVGPRVPTREAGTGAKVGCCWGSSGPWRGSHPGQPIGNMALEWLAPPGNSSRHYSKAQMC